jgi:hypothetical protein
MRRGREEVWLARILIKCPSTHCPDQRQEGVFRCGFFGQAVILAKNIHRNGGHQSTTLSFRLPLVKDSIAICARLFS